MITGLESICLPTPELAPAQRSRLARYLELPSAGQIDVITAREIRKLDERRQELLSPWRRAIAIGIERVDGTSIRPHARARPIQASVQYGRLLREAGADALVVAGLTLGGRVDEQIRHHLERDELFEAFVLKQWAATMAEQARAELTSALRPWAQRHRRVLLPYDGPGYNGWPLDGLGALLDTLFVPREPASALGSARPICVTDGGGLMPTNSMLIVFGLARRAAPAPADEALAQCHRCAMRNCRYRVREPAAMLATSAG